MSKIKILIVDDHQLIIDGIKANLVNVPDFSIVGNAYNGREAIAILNSEKADVILMDIDMPILDGMGATQQIMQADPTAKIIVLTMHTERGLVKKMISMGASGYILKNTGSEELSLAIRKVYSGLKYFSSEITTNFLEKKKPQSNADPKIRLTSREEEILVRISQGLSNKEIGDKLSISHRTVDKHRTNIMSKLNITNVANLVRYAVLNGYCE